MWEGILNYFLTRFGFRSERKRAREEDEEEEEENEEVSVEPTLKQRKTTTPSITKSFTTSDQFLCPVPNWRNSSKRRSMATCQQRGSGSKSENTWFTETKENIIDISDGEDLDVLGVWQDANTLRKRPVYKTGTTVTNGGVVEDGDEDDDVQVVKVIESHSKEIERSRNRISILQTPSTRVSSVRRLTLDSAGAMKSPLLHQRLKILHPKSSRSTGVRSRLEQAEELKQPKLNLKLALNESFRLEDKMKYSELLQQFTNVPLNVCYAPQNHIKWTQKKDVLDFDAKEVIDLTKPRHSRKHVEVRKEREFEPKLRLEEAVEQSSLSSQTSSIDSGKFDYFTDPDIIQRINEKFKKKKEEWKRQAEEEQLKAEHFQKREKKLQLESLERLTNYLKITDSMYEDVILEEKAALPKLTLEMEKVIDVALIPKPPNELLIEAFGLPIKRHDMQTLAGLNWLNDEVINFYMELLRERGQLENYPSVYAFNTFFYPRLLTGGHEALRRWTRKVDIFSFDLIVIPVHLGVHWCMAAVDFRDKTIKYYDSMGAPNNKCLESLMNYLRKESLDKKKSPFDTTGWRTENVQNIPQQMNGSDCGMFSCTYAEYICRNANFTFTQQDMPYFRRKMVYEISTRKLLL